MTQFTRSLTAGAALIAGLTGALASEIPFPWQVAGEGPAPMEMALSVETVVVVVEEGQPSGARVSVTGTVPTAGYGPARLEPLQTFAPEIDQMSFTLVVTPPAPDAIVAQVVSPVSAELEIADLPAEVVRIRVLSRTNEMVAEIAR